MLPNFAFFGQVVLEGPSCVDSFCVFGLLIVLALFGVLFRELAVPLFGYGSVPPAISHLKALRSSYLGEEKVLFAYKVHIDNVIGEGNVLFRVMWS